MRFSIFTLALVLSICSTVSALDVPSSTTSSTTTTITPNHNDCYETFDELTSCFFDQKARYICCTTKQHYGLDCTTGQRKPFFASAHPSCTVEDADGHITKPPSPDVSPVAPPVVVEPPVAPSPPPAHDTPQPLPPPPPPPAPAHDTPQPLPPPPPPPPPAGDGGCRPYTNSFAGGMACADGVCCEVITYRGVECVCGVPKPFQRSEKKCY